MNDRDRASDDRVRRCDPQALAEFYRGAQERLKRMVRLRMDPRLQGRIDASDVLQDAYLEAARRLEEYAAAPRLSPFHWLRFITAQKLLELHRRHLGTQMQDARGEEIRTLEGHEWGATCLDISSDGNSVAAGAGFGAPTVRVWDAVTGESEATFVGHVGEVVQVDFVPGRPWLLSSAHDHTLRVWSLTGDNPPRIVDQLPASLQVLAIHPDGRQLLSGGFDGRLVLWNLGDLVARAKPVAGPAQPELPLQPVRAERNPL